MGRRWALHWGARGARHVLSPKDIAFFFNELSSLLLLLSKGNGTLTYVRYFDVTRSAAKARKEGGKKREEGEDCSGHFLWPVAFSLARPGFPSERKPATGFHITSSK